MAGMARRYFLSRRIEERSERGILIRPREKGEKEKKKKKEKREKQSNKIFSSVSREKSITVDVFVPKRDSISKSIDRLREREREKENDTFSPIILPKMVIYRRVATTINRNVSY